MGLSNIFQRQGLINADGSPGANWGELTGTFNRTDLRAMETLGNFTAHLLTATVEFRFASEYREPLQRFAEAAEPPITGILDGKDLNSPEGRGAVIFNRSADVSVQNSLNRRPGPAKI